MGDVKTERFHCNACGQKTKHFIRSEFIKRDEDEAACIWFKQRLLTIECCGCENLQFVMKTLFSEDIDYYTDPVSGEPEMHEPWDEIIYPPVTYRDPPLWFDDLPDETLCKISVEIYKSLQTESHYLATFGSRTLIDRLIVLTVGDQRNFKQGLNKLEGEGMLSKHEREILEPVVNAGNAAAHRGWAPTKDQLKVILDTVEGLIHRLLVLPKLSEELEEAVPSRNGAKELPEKITIEAKVKAAPQKLRTLYNKLHTHLKSLGDDVMARPQKHYMAFKKNRNFASVQIYSQKKIIRVYLNLNPDTVEINSDQMRDVRQIGHFGTGDLEVVIKSPKDIDDFAHLFQSSYEVS